MIDDFHDKEFDDSTKVKLDLYRKYLSEWIPTFVQFSASQSIRSINIFDFFSGAGDDDNGNDGSPLIAIKEVLRFEEQIVDKGCIVNLYFFDQMKSKVARLESLVKSYKDINFIKIHCVVEKFPDSFYSCTHLMDQSANMVFLDQYGIKCITEPVLKDLFNFPMTDFMFYISSSFFMRFAGTSEFKKYNLVSSDDLIDVEYTGVHRKVCDCYRRFIPKSSNWMMAPFSIQKEHKSNIYGLVFGASHHVAMEKFLRTAWSENSLNGEANFDIDGDAPPVMDDLFSELEPKKITKIESFQGELENEIISGNLKSDKEVYLYSIRQGFVPTMHAKPVVIRLKQEKKITVEGRVRLSKLCYNDPRPFRLVN